VFARTKRLTLRPGWAEDAAELARTIDHQEVARMLARVPWPYDNSDAEAFLSLPTRLTEPRLLILEHVGNTAHIVGGIGLHREGDAHELGYWLTPGAWGRGIATEAGRAVIDMARETLGLRQLHARHFLDNPASGKVLRTLGFRATGEVKRMRSRAREGASPCATYTLDLVQEDRSVSRMAA